MYTIFVRNVTLSADGHLIEQARTVARLQHKTLNAAFREWLAQYAAQDGAVEGYQELMGRLRYARSTGPYTRDAMNER